MLRSRRTGGPGYKRAKKAVQTPRTGVGEGGVLDTKRGVLDTPRDTCLLSGVNFFLEKKILIIQTKDFLLLQPH